MRKEKRYSKPKIFQISIIFLLASVLWTLPAVNANSLEGSRHYVLIHGAWHGGWAWKEVAAQLRAKGHTVSTPTLAGLGEHSHMNSPEIGLYTHVKDIISHLEMEDLRDVVLVGHSYAGMVVAGVLGKNAERVKTAVFLDAVVPVKGKGFADYIPAEGKKRFENLYEAKKLVDPPPVESWGKRWGLTDPKKRAWAAERMTPQSPLTFLETVTADPMVDRIDYVYIRCEQNKNPLFAATAERVKQDNRWKFISIDSHHDVMVLVPDEVTNVLSDL